MSPKRKHHHCPCPGSSQGEWVECVTPSAVVVTSNEDPVTCFSVQML